MNWYNRAANARTVALIDQTMVALAALLFGIAVGAMGRHIFAIW